MKSKELPLFPEKTYHIYTHANGKENLFENRGNYDFFLKRYAYFIQPIAHTFAYCLMPNHVHFLIRIRTAAELQEANKRFIEARTPARPANPLSEDLLPAFISRTFGNLFSSYTQAFNRQQDRKGSLFIPAFKRKEVDSDIYYTKLVHYIHANPVRHGFVNHLTNWEYSSYHALVSDKATRLCRSEVIEWFGNKQAFIEFHQAASFEHDFEL